MQQLNHNYGQTAISEKKKCPHVTFIFIWLFLEKWSKIKVCLYFRKENRVSSSFHNSDFSVVQEEQTCLAHGETSPIIHLALNDQSSNAMKHSGQESKAQKMGCSRHQRVESKKLTLNHTFFCQKSVTGDFFLVW